MKVTAKIVTGGNVDPRYVELRLPFNTAKVLRGLVGQVSGPVQGPRGHTDAIHAALDEAGVSRRLHDPSYFVNYPEAAGSMPNGEPTAAEVRDAWG